MAEGTDYEALPFYREDRTAPGVVRADVPLLLLTVDTFPPGEGEAKDTDAPRGADVPKQPDVHAAAEGRDYYVRFPWPFGAYQKRGVHRNWLFTGFLLADAGLGTAGPVGRSMSSDAAVRDDLFPALEADAEAGGVRSLPFVFARTLVDHGDLPDVEGRDLDEDIHLWPLFAWGGGSREDHEYLAVMPFGGTTKGLLGKEEITWFGFPYPLYAHVQDRAYESHHVLWPLVNWVDGPQNSGMRVLPFFGHYERRGVKGNPIYDRTYILWPLISWSTSGMNEEASTDTVFVFPFYGRIRGPDYGAITFLWPFFKYDETRVQGGVDWELRAPFPFLQIAGGPSGSKFDMWPLFGVKTREGFSRHFALWPIWRYEDMDAPGKTFSGQWLMPLFWRTRWEEKDTGRVEHKWRAFPLMHYRSYRDGSLDVGGLSPWWFDDEGWERTLGHLLRLYRYRRTADGGVDHQALLGLFSYRDLPAQPAVDGAPARADYTRLSLLFGMVQYRELGEESGLRLLWLLPELTWGGGDPPREDIVE